MVWGNRIGCDDHKFRSGVGWDDPENVIILASGTLGNTQINGSGTFSAVTKGPMTNGAAAGQANGLFGAFIMMN
jgi:aldehyde:ferredoxin oxidoreductase